MSQLGVSGGEIRRPRLMDPLVAAYAREIVSGRLQAGDAMPSEPELAGRFGISKVVVRDSLKALVAVGLIRVQQGKRTVVVNGSEWDALSTVVQQAYRDEGATRALLDQFYEARLIVEPQASALAATRATDAQVGDLLGLARTMLDIGDGSRDISDFLLADRRFHDLVATAVGNIALRSVIRSLHVETASSWTASRIESGDLAMIAIQHHEVAKAIADRRAPRARDAMAVHIRAAQRLELARLDQP